MVDRRGSVLFVSLLLACTRGVGAGSSTSEGGAAGTGGAGEGGGDASPDAGGYDGGGSATAPQGGAPNHEPQGGAGGDTGVAPTPRCADTCARCYLEGHGDVLVDYAPDAGLRLMLRAALDPGQWEQLYEPETVCIVVSYERQQVVARAGGRPRGAAWEPVGVPEGAAFWQLPGLATPKAPWLGVAVVPLPVGTFAENRVVLELGEVTPPDAAFAAYVTSALGAPEFLLSSSAGLREVVAEGGSHAHMNWTFTAPGAVEVTFRVTATTEGGATVTSEPARFRFLVEAE
jgi:surface-anchored protein